MDGNVVIVGVRPETAGTHSIPISVFVQTGNRAFAKTCLTVSADSERQKDEEPLHY
jgi:hypothetical protein